MLLLFREAHGGPPTAPSQTFHWAGLQLCIFSARQVRRAMEGARRLGMVAPGPDRSVAPVAAECEITECQPLPDGCEFGAIGNNVTFLAAALSKTASAAVAGRAELLECYCAPRLQAERSVTPRAGRHTGNLLTGPAVFGSPPVTLCPACSAQGCVVCMPGRATGHWMCVQACSTLMQVMPSNAGQPHPAS